MGLFDFFKSKPIVFKRRCLIKGPEYLKENFKDIPDELMKNLGINESEHLWVRQIKSPKGSTKFKIKYFGEQKRTLITSKNDLPPMVLVSDVESDESILLFDGAKHGYNAVFWEEFPGEIKNRAFENTYGYKENQEFEIVMIIRYSPHIIEQFEEEFSRNGFVENNRGEKLGKEALLNGYDSIEIFAFGKEYRKIMLLAEETA